MSDGCKRILSFFTGHRKRKAWNKTREKYKPVKRRQNLAGTDRRSCYNKEEWLEEFLDGKSAFYNDSESDDNDQQQLPEGFSNCCNKIFFPILLELISNFAICKHCSGTLLLLEDVRHSFGIELHISKRNHTF